MARKRGGLAGFYDRNKGWLKKAVPAGLSFIPGVGIPLAAAAGAAFGADTEGRNFFNMSNIPGALRGAAEGYGIGKGTQALAGGVKGLLAPKAAGGGAMGGGAAAPDMSQFIGLGQDPTKPYQYQFGDDMFAKSMQTLTEGGKGAKGVSSFKSALMQPQVLGAGIQGLIGQLPSAQSAALESQTKLAREQFEEEKKQREREEKRRQLMAELLMPYASQNFGQYFGGGR